MFFLYMTNVNLQKYCFILEQENVLERSQTGSFSLTLFQEIHMRSHFCSNTLKFLYEGYFVYHAG